MKNLTLSLLFISFFSLSFSQEKLVWHEDLKEAVTISQKENKPLMLLKNTLEIFTIFFLVELMFTTQLRSKSL